jgi:hypothetical protein
MKGRRARSEAAVADAVVRLKRGLTAPHRTNVSMNTASLRNLLRRPARPSLNRGPVQRRAKYALWALKVASTSQIAEWTHVRARVRGLRSANHTQSARRVLERIAVRVGRANTIGRPWMWKLREPTAPPDATPTNE